MARRAQRVQAEEEDSSEGEAEEGPQAQGGGQEGLLVQVVKASIMSVGVSSYLQLTPPSIRNHSLGFVFNRKNIRAK